MENQTCTAIKSLVRTSIGRYARFFFGKDLDEVSLLIRTFRFLVIFTVLSVYVLAVPTGAQDIGVVSCSAVAADESNCVNVAEENDTMNGSGLCISDVNDTAVTESGAKVTESGTTAPEIGKISTGLSGKHREGNTGKVVLMVIDRIGWKDIYEADTPNIDRLMEIGAIGLMTTNTAGSRSCNNLYVTMGAGARITGSANSPLSFSSEDVYQGQKITDLYYQITGRSLPAGAIANLGIAQVYRNNLNRPYPVRVGALGTALRQEGYSVAVIGNSDRPDKQLRYLPSMLMDDRGVVPMGEVGQTLIAKDGSRPFGIRLDSDKMIRAVEEVWDKADVVAIEWGDTYRAEDYRYNLMDSMLEVHRRKALEDGDAFIGRLLNKLDLKSDLIMVFTPLGPLRELKNNNRLTPIIIAGKGVDRGWVSSPSTHRMGVVTNLDVGVTILNFFGISPLSGQGGAVIGSVRNDKGIEGILTFNQRLVEIFNQRPFLIRSFVFSLIAVVGASLFVLFFKTQYLHMIKPCLLFIMLIPHSYLLLSMVHQPVLIGSVLIALLIALVLTIIVWYVFRQTLDKILAVCVLLVVILSVDQWTGARLIQGSPLGYDVISGARFYGIGNEYMGALVGAACIGGACLIERFVRYGRWVVWGVLLCLAVVLSVLALPWWGANVGGAVSAFAAFGILAMLVTMHSITWRRVVAMAAVLAVLLTAIFILDSFRAIESQSHMGQTVKLVQENGVQELFNIAYRKISMNIRLFRYTIWTRVFLSSLVSMIILFYRPEGIFKDVRERYPNLSYGFISGLVGSIAAFAVNDSGIVAAATSMIYVGLSFILIITQRLQEIIMEKKGAL